MHDEQISRPDGLKRVLGPINTTCIVIGSIIGVVFFSPSQVTAIAGSANLALFRALTFAELGGLYSRNAGGVVCRLFQEKRWGKVKKLNAESEAEASRIRGT